MIVNCLVDKPILILRKSYWPKYITANRICKGEHTHIPPNKLRINCNTANLDNALPKCSDFHIVANTDLELCSRSGFMFLFVQSAESG